MRYEELKTRYDRLVNKVKNMRLAQIDYFKYRGQGYLDKARRYERDVDEIIREEVKIQESKQQDLF